MLASRQSHRALPDAKAQKHYREQVLDDRARVLRRFGIKRARTARGADVDNDTGLPPPKRTKLAKDIYQWCRFNAWSMCADCRTLLPRDMTEKSLSKPLPPVVTGSACSRCKAKIQCAAPTPEYVPVELRGLIHEACKALSPLEVDVGPEIRAEHNSGHRQHCTMIRFKWHELSTKHRIEELADDEQRAQAKSARRCLRKKDGCSYKDFDEKHKKFLEKYDEPDERQRRRRMQFIETPGLECALWPTLFFDDSMCLTTIRATDVRRLAAKKDADSSDSENDDADTERHSTKRAYAALALCSRLGFGSSYEILHFAYDLKLWSGIGGKKTTSIGYDVPMRVLMKGHSFSPLYWKSVHFALLDMVRQVGYPKIFWTISPYEFSFPYSEWLKDEMSKELRGRLHLAVGETLHVTHCLLQVVKGALLGATGQKRGSEIWQRHVFQACDEKGDQQIVRAFLRVEFQDGTRKLPTQSYHGSGRPHLHVLIFCSDVAMADMNLDESVLATMPTETDEPDDILPAIVAGSQLDRHGKSGWPVENGQSHWDFGERKLRLNHTEEDASEGLRPYIADLMESLRCHQDFQCADDDGALRAYVTKYVSKFSDSNQDEWLNDKASGDTIASTVLYRYKPYEPEMCLQLFGASMRQWFVTTNSRGKRDFVVPWPQKDTLPQEIDLYQKAEWAAGKIPLLDFLRKTNKSGKVIHWLKRQHGKVLSEDEPMTVEDYAAAYKMQGESVLAADMLSRLNDLFYGQWLVLHVPFENITDFYEPIKEQLKLVPKEHHNFAMCLLSKHPVATKVWQDEDAIRQELKQEALTKSFTETIMAMYTAHAALVDKYLTGEANAVEEETRRAERRAVNESEHDEGVYDFNKEQLRCKVRVDEAVDRAESARNATEEEADDIRQDAFDNGKVFVCTGGPGTGKTTVAMSSVNRALAKDLPVLFAYPTNRQASRMRAKLGRDVHVDTCHAAFGIDEELGAALPSLVQYALIVVDEFSQLQMYQFEHIVKLWRMADQLPALLFLGDEFQIAGFGDERPWHSPLWRQGVFKTKLHKVYRCKDPDFNEVLQELRTSRPCKETLKWLQGHKAWAPPGEITIDGVRKLLKSHPETTVLTCTRRGMAMINDLALKALFPNFPPLVVLPGDIEANPENYEDGKLFADEWKLQPLELKIYKGMKVVLTRNIRKDIDYVNGMDATVESYHARNNAVEVFTATGYRVMVWPWTDVDRGHKTYYPLRPGYADTIIKFQGSELPHVTVLLDCPGIPGAAYTALSRVAYGKDFLIGGIVGAEHFQPVDESLPCK